MRTDSGELLALGIFNGGSRIGERIAALLERGRVFSAGVEKTRVAWSALALLGCLIAGALAPRVIAFAQQLKFDAASVRVNKSGERKWALPRPEGGRFVATNVSLGMLVVNAYGVPAYLVSGGPGWLNSDRFDVEGRAQGNPIRQQYGLMLQALLEDRFKLAVHRETRQLPVYELVVSKGGTKLKESKCVGEPSPANPCGGFSVSLHGSIIGREVGVSEFAANLGSLLSREVIDKTGLAGNYNFDLHWTADDTTLRGPGDPDDPPPDPSGPSLFTALQEQLGLELKSSKGPVEMLVIDHAEKPDEN